MKILRRLTLCALLGAAPLCSVDVSILAKLSLAAEKSPAAGPVQFNRYDNAAGESYFALSLQADLPARDDRAHDLVIVVDTSASQVGLVREKALQSLKAFLALLPAEDRVCIIAADVTTENLTSGFVEPMSDAAREAVAALTDRVPLGNTDLPEALKAAVATFDSGSNEARAVAYFGDGMSTGHLLAPEDTRAISNLFVDLKAPLNCFMIGPKVDTVLLSTLANHTGGMILIDNAGLESEAAGTRIESMTHASVAWPTDSEFPEGLSDHLPGMLQPLRSDRDTVLLGSGTLTEAGSVAVQADVNGQPMELVWDLAPAAANEDFSYLDRLVDLARKDQGMMPTIGTVGLVEAGRLVNEGAQGLADLGAQAVHMGQLDDAERLAAGALRADPNNAAAQAVARVAAQGVPAGAREPVRVAANNQRQAQDDDALILRGNQAGNNGRGRLLEEQTDNERLLSELLQKEVQATINKANRLLATDPVTAIAMLKERAEQLRSAPATLDPEVRSQLQGALNNALRNASRRETEMAHQRLQIEANRQQVLEEERILQDLHLQEERTVQLMDRFNALMDEGRYRDAEQVAKLARELAPNRSAPNTAVHFVDMVYPAVEALQLRHARWTGVIDALASVERSHIPMADEPPIVYPDPEVWRRLTERRKDAASIDLSSSSPVEKRIYRALEDEASLEFDELPISEALEFIESEYRDKYNFEIILDPGPVADGDIQTDSPVTISVQGVSLRSALRRMLEQLDLTFVVEDEVLLITTKDIADTKMITKVYPVADLVVPPSIGTMLGGGGGGFGGQGGGFGGGGQGGFGGGGGGFGGQGGGGFGGGGLGGGGGGLFNIPPGFDFGAGGPAKVLPQPGGFRVFYIEDDLRLTPNGTRRPATKPAVQAPATESPAAAPAETAEPTEPAAPVEVAEAIQLEIAPGADLDAAWLDYFRTHEPSAASVRETIRQLGAKKDHAQVVALIRGALRTNNAQPMMYEIMAVSMLLNGSDRAEVERALLSALDFVDNLYDMMYVALHLERNDFDARALSVYEQAHRLAPMRPEPLVRGLALAQKLDDVHAIQVFTSAILSQAWPKESGDLWVEAGRLAHATLDRLKAEGNSDLAATFEEALNKAMVRDCIVRVTWSGEADVDLLMEEPSGTICSTREPRSISGGILLSDGYAKVGESGKNLNEEYYVCPEGFSGTYRMRIRRVWGEIPTGKVTVEIYKHFNTPEAQYLKEQISLGDKDEVYAFDVEHGRRMDALEEQQLANAALAQINVREDVLAQQTGSSYSSNRNALENFFRRRQWQNFAAGGRPFFNNGAVGYQPVIIQLQEGAQMAGVAVISADRRYVRFGGSPQFSGITEVNTFNTFSGASGTSNGGTGGSGFGGNNGGFGGGGQGGGGGGFGGGGGGGLGQF